MTSEFRHFSHPDHKLDIICLNVPFTCDGCYQVSSGHRYNCSLCNFDLHIDCATAKPIVTTLYHPFGSKCKFIFLTCQPGNSPKTCIACGKVAHGFVYHCHHCRCVLHPCCANLPCVLNVGDLPLHLHYRASASCYRCGSKGKSWAYRSSCKKINFHVACVNAILLENWHETCGGGSSAGMEMVLRNAVEVGRHHHNRKAKKWCMLAKMTVKIIFAIVNGDPVSMISEVASSLTS